MKNRYIIITILLSSFVISAAILYFQALPLDEKFQEIKQDLNFPPADYNRIISVENKLLALAIAPDKDNYDKWWYSKVGDQELSLLNFPSDPKCGVNTSYDGFYPRSDGRFDLRKHCLTNDQGRLVYLISYDWNTGNMEEITGPLPSRAGSGFVTWNQDFSRGIMSMEGYSEQTLYWIWPGGFGPIDLVVADQARSWNLKDDYPDYQGGRLGETGNASFPAWSPDGNTIAFFGSVDAIGKIDADRFYAKYSLYMMDAEKLEPEPVADGFYFPYISKWSPDSQWLAFTANRGSFLKKSGVWLFSKATHKLLLLSEGNFGYFIWNPDGESLIAIRCNELGDDCSQIEQYDLSDVLE